tara:strand:+ start:313 stop:459 length:147 start_codon:yes stop_codon:yes gene_type:complete
MGVSGTAMQAVGVPLFQSQMRHFGKPKLDEIEPGIEVLERNLQRSVGG